MKIYDGLYTNQEVTVPETGIEFLAETGTEFLAETGTEFQTESWTDYTFE